MTSSKLTGYITLTAHYVNHEWGLVKSIISFNLLPSPHTVKAIADWLRKFLLEWKALNKKAFVTLENTSSNNIAMNWFQNFIQDCSQSPGAVTLAQFLVQCLTHFINFFVKEGLKTVSTAIENLWEIVFYIHASSAKMEDFDKAIVYENIDTKKQHK